MDFTPVYIVKNKVAIFTCLFTSTLFFAYKPLYTVLLFTIFSHEHFLFASLINSLLKAKKSERYACFSVIPLQRTTFGTTYEIWLKINEIYAYRRLYSIVASKELNLWSILFTFIIIFFGLPVKVYKIMRFLIRHNYSLYESLTYFYDLNYKTVENQKIEIIYKKIYLNPLTKADIIGKIIRLNPQKSSEEVTEIYIKLVKLNHSFMSKDEVFKSAAAPFKLGFLTTEEGLKIKIPHWTNSSSWKISGEKVFSAIHVTSNMPTDLSDTQLRGVAMQELLKPASIRPGSIVTNGDFVFKPIDNRQKLIKSWQLHYVMYDVYKGELDSQYINEFNDRDSEVMGILGPRALSTDISEFSACLYDSVLRDDYGKSFLELLNEIADMTK